METSFSLDDKYTCTDGRIAITGLQALVRLPMVQSQLDRAAGLRTGTFITGYQGSPLGEYDKQLSLASKLLREHHITHQPGINEEISATALWGAQLLELFPHERYDGIVSIWYGKSPGVDRTGDAFRHANFLGTSRFGAAIALAGDDTACKSSTIPGDSTVAFYDLMFPLLFPADPIEVVELGLHGIAMSRYCGLWSALKIVTNVADGGGIFEVSAPTPPRIPELEINGKLFQKKLDHRLLPPYSLEMEQQIFYERSVAALAYARENRLDRITVRSESDRVGVIAAGKSYRDLIHALDLLGLGEESLRKAGIRLYKLGMIAPIEPEGLREFARGLREVVVIEEKRGFMETLVREILYDLADHPLVFGKRDSAGRTLFPSHSDLSADQIAILLAEHLGSRLDWPELLKRSESLRAANSLDEPPLAVRTPYYCSGCPHNQSTRLPMQDEPVGGGIGCSAMAVWMDRGISWLAQMGGDGASWIGLAPFTEKQHLFQNVGDGTFAHSASKALEACVAADINITFRILFNKAVAMTGGQDVVGLGSPSALARQLEAQGVKRIEIVTDQPQRYSNLNPSPLIRVRPREEYDEVQDELSKIRGVTAIIYDQQCAAEKRRERKRGIQPTPRKRVYINESLCEGCGDCGSKSNCLSVTPVDTQYGRKTRIHQSSCNLDYSCLEGHCPSFLTVTLDENAAPRSKSNAASEASFDLPEPAAQSTLEKPYKILMVGIGGTGVVTVDALLVTAALLDGKFALHLDQTGLSQKGGAVVSNFILDNRPIVHSNKIATTEADLILGFDLIASVAPDNLKRLAPAKTRIVANTAQTSTPDVITDTSARMPELRLLQERLTGITGDEGSHWIDAEANCERLFGNTASSNVFLLGVAYQAGSIPISAGAIESALRANGVAIDQNLAAFRWGRRSVSEPDALGEIAQVDSGDPVIEAREKLSHWAPKHIDSLNQFLESAPTSGRLAEMLPPRIADLLLYQGKDLAGEYLAFVQHVLQVEQAQRTDSTTLTEAVAAGYFKLLAVKDEYEIARLWLQDPLYQRVSEEFDGKIKRSIMLTPPFLRALGIHRKFALGQWIIPMLKILYAARYFRGGPLDLFGRTRHRRLERSLASWYRRQVEEALTWLTAENHSTVTELAELTDRLRGFEEIKERNLAVVKIEVERLLEKLRAPTEDL